MSQTKNILLIGCGAEIGSMLVGMVKPEVDGFSIGAILTNDISGDSHHPEITAIDSLMARIILAQPHLIDELAVSHDLDGIVVRDHIIPVVWGDITKFDLTTLPGNFDLAIIATSKNHINDDLIVKKFLQVAKYVVGVAEAVHLPAIYPSLINAPDRFLDEKPTDIGDHRVFCLGSCQSNGWQAQLRAILELIKPVVFDPLALPQVESFLGDSISYAGSVEGCVSNTDLVVVTTPWADFKTLPLDRDKPLVIIDGWKVVENAAAYDNVQYLSLGCGPKPD
jgi:hypothetical protein